jgi:Protein of unknown function (DUF2778)
MLQCSFKLNDQPMSTFTLGASSFPAFSGLRENANKRAAACLKGIGPIPLGNYYIFDREAGGLLGSFRDVFTGRSDWFALYAADALIDDATFCDGVKRGNFRLHPKGSLGRSEGCVVIDKLAHFMHLRALLKSMVPVAVPGSKLNAYAILAVT